MDLPKQTLDTLNANVYEGTSLAWDISFSQPLSDAEMMTDDGNRLPIDLSPGRRSGKAFTLPTKSFNYQLRMTLRDYPFSYLDRVHYYVQVLPDGPPKIRIIYPQKEKDIATRSRSLNVRFRAEDDHGISAAWLVYSINKGEEKKSLMNEYSDRTITGKASSKLLALAPYLKEGDSFEYLIEVADNRGTDAGPSLSRSRGHTLEIVSVENFLRKVTGKKKELDTEIEAVNKEEKEGLGKVRSMKDDDEEIEESSTPTP
jgi:hypothetical protein